MRMHTWMCSVSSLCFKVIDVSLAAEEEDEDDHIRIVHEAEDMLRAIEGLEL